MAIPELQRSFSPGKKGGFGQGFYRIGLAVILFYVLLLSISEHMNFNGAYILSAMAITFLITGYARGILRDKRFTLTLFSILTVLYSYLFIVIQLEDYALIMGSMGLFAVLSTVMYITRNINWYELGKRDGGV
jgi:inner membrane protein